MTLTTFITLNAVLAATVSYAIVLLLAAPFARPSTATAADDAHRSTASQPDRSASQPLPL